MGVKGLWQLLQPVARPIKIETLEGKRLAIDSSIWLYQFQATMKDKEGRTLTNAHVLGFLRRINKLLFHGIKPVFVFDGGAPSLKKNTIADRRKKKSGAKAGAAQMAEKLFAAQLRKEAVKTAQAKKLLKRNRSTSSASSTRNSDSASHDSAQDDGENDTGAVISNDATFLDDYEPGARPRPRLPSRTSSKESSALSARRRRRRGSSASGSDTARSPSPDPSLEPPKPKKQKYATKDPYELPALDRETLFPSNSNKQDPRLASEEELKEFIDEIQVEDFDVTSSEFQSLPQEVKYEIINDLRLRSRGSNHHRLQSMLTASKTPLDFSKAQIKNLKTRNELTQQMWGLAGVDTGARSKVQVRLANERGKEYVLMKNEGKEGGWVLGVRDEGTAEKPIYLEEMDEEGEKKEGKEGRKGKGRIQNGVLSAKELDSEDEKEIAEMERRSAAGPVDEELRAHRREMALDALAKRYSPLKKKPLRRVPPKPTTSFGPSRPSGSAPLFDFEDDDDDDPMFDPALLDDDLADTAGKSNAGERGASVQEQEDAELARAIELSERDWSGSRERELGSQERGRIFNSSGDEMEEVGMDGEDMAASRVPMKASSDDDDMEEVELPPLSEPALPDGSLPPPTAAEDDFVSDLFDIGPSPSPPESAAASTPSSRIQSAPASAHPSHNIPSLSLTHIPSAPGEEVGSFAAPEAQVRHPASPPPPSSSTYSTSTSSKEAPMAMPPLDDPPPIDLPSDDDCPPSNAETAISANAPHSITSTADSSDDMEAIDGDVRPSVISASASASVSASPSRSPAPIHIPSTPPTIPSSPPVSSSPPLLPSSPDLLPNRPLSPLSIARRFSQLTPALRPSSSQTNLHKQSPRTPSGPSGSGFDRTPTGIEKAVTSSSVAREAARRQAQLSGSGSERVQKRSGSTETTPTGFAAFADSSTKLPPPPAFVAAALSSRRTGSPPTQPPPTTDEATEDDEPRISAAAKGKGRAFPKPTLIQAQPSPPHPDLPIVASTSSARPKSRSLASSPSLPPTPPPQPERILADDEEIEWSASPTPPPPIRAYIEGAYPEPPSDLDEEEGGIDMNAEEDDYARFLSQVKGKDLKAVQDDLDDEIKALNAQKKKAMRDGDESINQQMVSQIQVLLRLYGIPYITAPMEAEAQCAELALLNLVDGVITDDSDVFLFGAKLCYKNMFNDSKYVECYLSHELDRELALDRDRLVTLAFLLGSDYTLGLPGVGYVTAMELMAEFPGKGDEGLVRFRNWWLKVQTGNDSEEETNTKWKKSFKKKNKDRIHVTAEFPNPNVRPAYFTPEVDSSDEPFAWGFPNLDQLRTYLADELSWSVSKVDDELTPIVQRIARRGHGLQSGLNKQGTLDGFFDTSGGATNVFAPRVRNTYPSQRLQRAVARFKTSVGADAKEAVVFANPAKEEEKDSGNESQSADSGVEEENQAAVEKRKKAAKAKATAARRKRAKEAAASADEEEGSAGGSGSGAGGGAKRGARGKGRGRGVVRGATARGRGRGGKAGGRGGGAAAAGTTGTKKRKKKADSDSATPSPSPPPADVGDDSDDSGVAPPSTKRVRKVAALASEIKDDEEEGVVPKVRARPKARTKQVRRESEDKSE